MYAEVMLSAYLLLDLLSDANKRLYSSRLIFLSTSSSSPRLSIRPHLRPIFKAPGSNTLHPSHSHSAAYTFGSLQGQ